MKKRIGKYITKHVPEESYKAYVPKPLPVSPPINLECLYPHIEKSMVALSELNSIHSIPNTSLFLYTHVRKEALLSSQIEGTQSSFCDLMLFEHNQKTDVSLEDVEEVSNYVKAINYGIKRLKEGFPLSLRLIKEIHAILLSGCRGSGKLPGEFRRSQNWIGGTRPGNAIFVPPPIEYLNECLDNFELFLHDKNTHLLIKAGIAHVQFETIHPFLDGNGRLGRLLITLLLHVGGVLNEPILYISLYLKQNRSLYYKLLQEVRERGNFEVWLEFFLKGIQESSYQVIKTTKEINSLFNDDYLKISTLGRARFSCEKVFEYMKKLPQVSVPLLEKELSISAPTVRTSLNAMEKLGIITEISNKKRDKIYVYRKYLEILENGANPF